MIAESTLAAIKGAILLEKKGKAFYESVAETTDKEEVRDIFNRLAMEEARHIEILTSQYMRMMQEGAISMDTNETPATDITSQVLTDRLKQRLDAAGYEAAAISAAIALERKAVAYYQERASLASNEPSKQLFTWLAEWEKSHVHFLTELDKAITDKVWFEKDYWPII